MRTFLATLVLATILVGCKTLPGGRETASTSAQDTQNRPSGEANEPVKNPVDDLFERVNAQIDAGKLDEASEKLKTAGQLAPNDPRSGKAGNRLAEAYAQRALNLGNDDKLLAARAELQKAIALDQTNVSVKDVAKQLAQAFADRAVKLRRKGNPAEAYAAVTSALELDGKNETANRLAKNIAQDYAIGAANLLDQGKEADARASLDAALKLDANNELANTLYSSLTVDPKEELGTKFFRYTVKPGDTLSKIAEQFLKDQYKFYLLARYNGIAVPRSIQAGNRIKVPGTKPKAAAAPTPAPPTPTPQPSSPPTSTSPPSQSATEKSSQIQSYDRKARECYRRQDMDCCIASWDKVLQLDPLNETAQRERDRCIQLRNRLIDAR